MDEFVRTCTFHPAYGYEDFLEGYSPQSVNGQVVFAIRDGVFKRFCDDAGRKPRSNFYLIIDENGLASEPRGRKFRISANAGLAEDVMIPAYPFREAPANQQRTQLLETDVSI